MTKNFGKDFKYGHETARPRAGENSPAGRFLFEALFPILGAAIAFYIARYIAY